MLKNLRQQPITFSRVVLYMDEKKGKPYAMHPLYQINYYLLIWMFCCKTKNKEIDEKKK